MEVLVGSRIDGRVGWESHGRAEGFGTAWLIVIGGDVDQKGLAADGHPLEKLRYCSGVVEVAKRDFVVSTDALTRVDDKDVDL